MARLEQALSPVVSSIKIYTFISIPNINNLLILLSPDFLLMAIRGSPKIFYKVKKNGLGVVAHLARGKYKQGNLIPLPFHLCLGG